MQREFVRVSRVIRSPRPFAMMTWNRRSVNGPLPCPHLEVERSNSMARTRTSLGRARAQCPRVSEHTDGPSSFSEWEEWATEMEKTHYQKLCPACGTYALWVPKVEARA